MEDLKICDGSTDAVCVCVCVAVNSVFTCVLPVNAEEGWSR